MNIYTINGEKINEGNEFSETTKKALTDYINYTKRIVSKYGNIKNPVISPYGLSCRGFENAVDKLPIVTPLSGKQQPTHPKVLYIEEGFGGHILWMAYTPYPNQNGQQENPCIVCSDDGIHWDAPIGVENPLDGTPTKGYNSDTHLVYREDTKTLEVWWRRYEGDNETETIYRRTSTDGTTWTEAEMMYQNVSTDGTIANIVSPCVIYDIDAGLYRIWCGASAGKNVRYFESATGKDWELKGTTNLVCWHLDIIESNVGYEAIIATETGSNYLAYATSTDGITWTEPIRVITISYDGFDNGRLYRSSFIKVDGYYYLYYAGVDSKDVWTIGLSVTNTPNDITTLRGYKSGTVVIDKEIKEVIEKLSNALNGITETVELTKPVYNLSNLDMSSASSNHDTGICPFAEDEDFTLCVDCTSQDTETSNYTFYMERNRDMNTWVSCSTGGIYVAYGVTGGYKAYTNKVEHGDNLKQIITHKKGDSFVTVQHKLINTNKNVTEEFTVSFKGANTESLVLNSGHMLFNSIKFYYRVLTDAEITEFMN
jgi:hypothetical protein